MVDDLLDVSQMETQRLHLERKWIDPLRLVRETVDRLAYVMKDLHVDISGSSDLLPVFADPGRVEQILGNLLSNAVKYSRPGSPVEFTAKRNGPDAVFVVRDRGIGVPEADYNLLFQPFHRARNVGDAPGTGLGLTIVKRCVDLSGGQLEFDSTEGVGTNVTVRLRLFPEH